MALGKESACQYGRHKRCRFDPWVRKIPWRRAWYPTPVFLPGGSQGQRSLEGYGPQGHKDPDMTGPKHVGISAYILYIYMYVYVYDAYVCI